MNERIAPCVDASDDIADKLAGTGQPADDLDVKRADAQLAAAGANILEVIDDLEAGHIELA